MFKKVNIKSLTKDYITSVLQTVRNLSWSNLLNTPVDYLYSKILEIRNKNLFLINHTSQKISLEHLFNNLVDVTGNKLIKGNPVYCETTGNRPICYSFTFEERDNGLVPNNTIGFYIYKNNVVQYDPLNCWSFEDEDYESLNPPLIEKVFWNFEGEDSGLNEYTIYLDSVDFVGLIGYDSNQQPIYAINSTLDIINKYAKQYSVTGVNYKIKIQP